MGQVDVVDRCKAASKLRRWLEDAASIESEILSTDYLDVEMVDAVGIALERRRGHIRLVVDLSASGCPRLRVRMVDQRGGWWLLDSWGRVAPTVKDLPAALAHPRRLGLASGDRCGL